jgi:hypothetical protein
MTTPLNPIDWQDPRVLEPRSYTCWNCGKTVGPNKGFYAKNPNYKIFICSYCTRPTYIDAGQQYPGIAYGNPVEHLPRHVEELYNEARSCMSVSAFTAAVLACRKMLVHIGVEQGAAPNLKFFEYIDFLAAQGFIPPNGRGWVDVIRKKGNEATHEIVLMKQQDAEQLISFTEMLLKFIYEFPAKVPAPPTP